MILLNNSMHIHRARYVVATRDPLTPLHDKKFVDMNIDTARQQKAPATADLVGVMLKSGTVRLPLEHR